MKSILVFVSFVALVYGRPEPPSGYNYPAPSSRYGAPTGNQGQGGFRSTGEQSRIGAGSTGSFAGATSSSFGGQSQAGFRSTGEQSGFGSGLAGGFGSTFSSAPASNGFGQSSRQSSGDDNASSGNIIINKHVYVHIAPPELEEAPQQKSQVRVPPPQKNYKIIFIKAPTSSTASQVPKLPPLPQNEEKTLVYVLVKKPEEQAEINIPTAAPTEPSKPEVYFIKYSAKKESHGEGQGVAGGEDSSQDDTVEVGAARQSNGAGQNGQAGSRQNGASAGGYSYSSSGSSAEVSRQYGAPNSSGPY